jgi:hypothetical protein
MSDVPPHVEVIGVILSGEDTLQKIIAMQGGGRSTTLFLIVFGWPRDLVNLGGLDNSSRVWGGLDYAFSVPVWVESSVGRARGG